MPLGNARPGGGDLSQRAGNSTSSLQQSYKQLMSIQDPDQLKQAALEVVQPLVGKGISPKNWATFQRNVMGLTDLTKLQAYITNYILKGSGLGVVGGGARFATEDHVLAISSLISEDTADVKLTDDQWRWKRLVELYGFHVGKLSTPRIDG